MEKGRWWPLSCRSTYIGGTSTNHSAQLLTLQILARKSRKMSSREEKQPFSKQQKTSSASVPSVALRSARRGSSYRIQFLESQLR